MSSITLVILMLLLSAFFSGLEIAFISVNKLRIELKSNQGKHWAKLCSNYIKSPSKFISTILVGNNIALVIYSYFMGKVIVGYLGISSILIQTIISTILILITAEFLPKAIFRVYANETLKIFALPAYIFYLLLYFFSFFINTISDFFLKLLFRTDKDYQQTEFSKEELGDYISEQIENGNGNEEEIDSEIQIFQNALEFQKVKAREIMVPRTEILAIEIHERVSKLSESFIDSGYSKILVYKTSLDDIIGHVNAFELFKKPKTIKSILLPVEIVPESMMISDVLNSLMKKRKSIAVVVDEYGGTSGMITVEDIVEELFGEIEDEHDVQELTDEKISDSKFKLSARLEIDYLNEEYNLTIPKEEAYETLGGYIIDHTENIPEKGEVLNIMNFKITILKVSSSKIEEIQLEIVDREYN